MLELTLHLIRGSPRSRESLILENVAYYNESRTHLGLEKECPVPRSVEPPGIGPIRKSPVLGGLHHRYFREAA
jgi:hypothetical protein